MPLDFTNLDALTARFRKASPNIAAAFDEVKKHLQTLAATSPVQEDAYTMRFATFNPETDHVTGCVNRYNHPANNWWWQVGTPEPPPGATLWPNGGGVHPIFTPHGPGFEIIVDKDMLYHGPNDSRLGRFTIVNTDTLQRLATNGHTHRWRWSWRRPSGQIWPTGKLLEGFCIASRVNGVASVGPHLYLDNGWQQAGPFHYYAAIQRSVSGWDRFHCPISFLPDQWHHIEWETRWSTGPDGWMQATTTVENGSPTQWLDYHGPTLPAGTETPYGLMMDIRPPLGDTRLTLQWANHRVLTTTND